MPAWLRVFGEPNLNGAPGYYLPAQTDALVTSILSAGTFFGALCAYPVGDYSAFSLFLLYSSMSIQADHPLFVLAYTTAGRRHGIQIFLVIFCIGVAAQTAATSLPAFIVGRVFAGFGVGGTSCLVPMVSIPSSIFPELQDRQKGKECKDGKRGCFSPL